MADFMRRDDDVIAVLKGLQIEGGPARRVIAAHHAHIGLAEQGLRLDAASQRRESADSYVDGSGLQLLDQGLVSEGDAADACARRRRRQGGIEAGRSEEHTSELQSLMRISYAVFCLKKKMKKPNNRKSRLQIYTTED